MHQVRAHLAHCGAPIVGDELYGGHPLAGLVGFFLHAAVVRFGGRTVEAPLPPDRVAALGA
jgi:23S rRNA-/tRNA-specific pseudouridylate synthase